MAPCILFEDEHLLVVNKPAGWNTHAPDLYAGEGLYEWLRHREHRWADLAILHRLDKGTSGVIVFGKTPVANRSLGAQFTAHTIQKSYVLLTDRTVPPGRTRVVSALVRAGERYLSRPLHAGADRAETVFESLGAADGRLLVAAAPVTGRTHQIRVHAAEEGFPIVGDLLYGGTPAPRIFLHARELRLEHPVTGRETTFTAPPNFDADPRLALRAAFLDAGAVGPAGAGAPPATNACRLVHGAADARPHWYVERLGDYLLSLGGEPLGPRQKADLSALLARTGARGAYHKMLHRQPGRAGPQLACPELVLGEAAPESFEIRENGVRFTLSFREGYSVGLFLDQRDNRRRLLTGHAAAEFPLPRGGEVLNAFAYTCGFSVCAALAGARVTSVDLSRKYLAWGARNFSLNGLDPAAHEFLYGDAFDWLRRLAKKGRRYGVIVLDPPTFSHSAEHGPFQAEKDYGALAGAALPLLAPDGVLLASTNAARLEPARFRAALDTAVTAAGRRVIRRHYAPQPPDFPVSRDEPAYLKTVWLQIA